MNGLSFGDVVLFNFILSSKDWSGKLGKVASGTIKYIIWSQKAAFKALHYLAPIDLYNFIFPGIYYAFQSDIHSHCPTNKPNSFSPMCFHFPFLLMI